MDLSMAQNNTTEFSNDRKFEKNGFLKNFNTCPEYVQNCFYGFSYIRKRKKLDYCSKS